MPKIFTTKDKKAASEMLLEGASVKAVATKFKVHVSTIYAVRKDLGHGYGFTNSACRNVHVRLTNKEFAALGDFVANAGFSSRTAALRSLIRAATGFLELPREEYLDLKAVRGELTAQGRNLNQIGYAMNKSAILGQAKLSYEDKAFISDARATFSALNITVSNAFSEVRQLGRDALHTAEPPRGTTEAVEAPQSVTEAPEPLNPPKEPQETPQRDLQAPEQPTATTKTLAGAIRRIWKP
jgi:transposase-like protein